MQATINFIQAIATSSNKRFIGLYNSAKSVLKNETYQKVFLFAAIMGLLLVAANLESIV